MKFVLSFIAATVLVFNLSAQTMSEVTEKFNAAGTAMQAKDLEKAAKLFDEVIDDGSTVEEAGELVLQAQRYLPQVLIMWGGSLAAQQNFDKSIEVLTEARDRSELYGNAQMMLRATQTIGKIYLASGADAYNNERYEEAVGVFSKGFEADPTNTDMALNLARSYDKLGDLENAVEVYASIIALESRHSRYAEPAAIAKKELGEAVVYKAGQAAEAKDYDEAIRLCELALEKDPENAMASMMRLQSANNKKDYKAVIEYGPSAAEAQTDDELKSTAYFLLGAAYQNTENKAKAIESFRKVSTGANAAQARQLVSDLQK